MKHIRTAAIVIALLFTSFSASAEKERKTHSEDRNDPVAVELGRPSNPQDGTMGIYINMGFSF